LTQLANIHPTAGNLATYGYGYDVDNSTGQYTMLGQRVSMTATVPSQGFNNSLTKYYYDPDYQLTRADYPNVAPFSGEIDQWSYDLIGNRLSNTVNGVTANYTYQKIGTNLNNWQRLLSDGVNSYTFDANGSTITRNGPSGNYTFGWDYENRMNGIGGAETDSYSYDYQGRRSSKTVSGTTTSYLYDGLNLVGEAGASAANYLFGPSTDWPLAMSRQGPIYYYSSDWLGSVALVADAAGGTQNTYTTDAWGVLRAQTGSLTNPFGYVGREFGEAGFWFLRHRWLAPASGRFLSEDPASPSEWGQYLYAAADPVLFIDPLGLFKVEPSCHCPGTPQNDVGGGVSAGVTAMCSYPKRPACADILKRFAFNGDDLGRCLKHRCDGPMPITCNNDHDYCGRNPAGVAIFIGVGVPGGNCPYQRGRGFGETVFEEAIHSCGLSDEPYGSGRYSKVFRKIMRVCTGDPWYNE
jgi:RHS repeat-associated protein